MIYLAAPYSSPSTDTRNWRYHRIRAALFSLWDAQLPAMCPIVTGHEYERRQRVPKSLPHEFWMQIARAQLTACTRVYVLTLPGWEESRGLREEVILAQGLDRPVQGYAPTLDCEAVSGLHILNTFGVALPVRPLLVLPRGSEE